MTTKTASVTLNLAKNLPSGVKFPFDFTVEYPEGEGMAVIASLGEQMTDPLIDMFAEIAIEDNEDRSLLAFENDETEIVATPENMTVQRHEVKFDANLTLKNGVTVPVQYTLSYPAHHGLTTIAMITMLPTQQRSVAATLATETVDGSIVNAMNGALVETV